MDKIPVANILADFQRMEREHWKYSSDTALGQVDCSGAFVWSYKQHGLSIYHGSNRIARRYVLDLVPYANAKAQGLIVPGIAAFKTRRPGDPKYALPSSYRKGGAYYNGDLLDYYHIGLVDEDTGYVLNAQGTATGFVRSPITQNWSHVALLKDVAYDGELPEADTVTITLSKALAEELLRALSRA